MEFISILIKGTVIPTCLKFLNSLCSFEQKLYALDGRLLFIPGKKYSADIANCKAHIFRQIA